MVRAREILRTLREFVAYFRVSTDRQSKSGLGLEAQRRSILNYLDGGRWSLVAEFTEIESGKRNDRPELQNALAACKKQRAKLVIAATHLPQTCSKQAIAIAQ